MAKKKGDIEFTVLPVTPDLWPVLEDLFGKSGASNGCWCMYWRLGGAYRGAPRGANRQALRQIVKQGSQPGLLAFDGDLPVGWCQLTSRDALPWLDHMWWFARVDAMPVRSISFRGVPIGCRSPPKRGPYSMPIHTEIGFAGVVRGEHRLGAWSHAIGFAL